MRSKGRQGKFSLIILFVGIFAFWWGIAVLGQHNINTTYPPQIVSASASSASVEGAFAPQTITAPLSITESSKDGLYTYSGSVPLSSACDELGSTISVRGVNTEHVTLVLTAREGTQACNALPNDTTQQFAISFSAHPGSTVVLDGLTLNGVIVPITEKKATQH